MQTIFKNMATLVVHTLLVSMVVAMMLTSKRDCDELYIGMNLNHTFGDALGFIALMPTVASFHMKRSLPVDLRY